MSVRSYLLPLTSERHQHSKKGIHGFHRIVQRSASFVVSPRRRPRRFLRYRRLSSDSGSAAGAQFTDVSRNSCRSRGSIQSRRKPRARCRPRPPRELSDSRLPSAAYPAPFAFRAHIFPPAQSSVLYNDEVFRSFRCSHRAGCIELRLSRRVACNLPYR